MDRGIWWATVHAITKSQTRLSSLSPVLGLALPGRKWFLGFPGGSDGKESACSAGNLGSITGLGRFPGERNSSPLQYSGLENSMDRGTWQATVHGIAKSHTLLSNFHAQSFWKCWWEERWLIFRVSLVGAEEGSSMWLEPQVQSREAGFGWRSCQVMGWLACNRLRLGERLEWRGGWAQGSHALKWHPYSLKFRLPPLHPAHPASQRVKC